MLTDFRKRVEGGGGGERERGRGRNIRVREKHQLVASHTHPEDRTCNLVCAVTGVCTCNILVYGTTLQPTTPTSCGHLA